MSGDSVDLRLERSYDPPAADDVILRLPMPVCYLNPLGDAVVLSLEGEYTPPPGDAVDLYLVCDGEVPGPPPPPPPYVYPGLTVRVGVAWSPVGTRCDADSTAITWRQAQRRDHAPAIAWQHGIPLDRSIASLWQRVPAVDASTAVAWSTSGQAVDMSLRAPWQRVPAKDQRASVEWGGRYSVAASTGVAWSNPPPKQRTTAPTWGGRVQVDYAIRIAWSQPPRKYDSRRIPWTDVRGVRFQALDKPPPAPPPRPHPSCYSPPPGDEVDLRFDGQYEVPPGDQVDLHITCTQRYFAIRRTRIVQHDLQVCRLPDREPVRVRRVSLSADRSSWAWTINAEPSERAGYHLLLPATSGPREIEAVIDGHVFTGLIEQASERRQMPQTRFSASGRSRTAVLAAPYAPQRAYTNTEAMTAQQLAERELDFTGFALDWQAPDWLVPAGAWSYARLTPLAAIQRLAQACGAVVQSHPEDLTVVVRPAYAAWPWEWETQVAPVVLDGQSVLEYAQEWRPGPQYMGVYVSGEAQGVTCRVRRAGSAGSPYAEQIIDPLIVDVAAADARGGTVIADAENRLPVTLVLPLMPAPSPPGVILPGELVQVEDTVHGIYKAIAESVAISADVRDDGLVTARQTVTVVRHLSQDLT